MALGGEVYDGIRLRHQLRDDSAITDIAAHEAVARVAFHIAQVVQVAGVGELVQVDHVVVVLRQHVADEVAADEAGAAGDEQGSWRSHQGMCSLLKSPRISV